jgi:hypothetical protein
MKMFGKLAPQHQSGEEAPMAALDLSLFTQADGDLEASQYRVLAGLADTANDFYHNRLYPRLADVVELTTVLESIVEHSEKFESSAPRALKGVDIEEKRLIFETVPADKQALEKMFELINWALPQLKRVSEEGVAMYEFVSEHLQIGTVGIVPMYRDEGYVMVPDNRTGIVHVVRYEMSLFTADDEEFRAMKTVEVETVDQRSVLIAPEELKLELIRSHTEMPNPATFICNTDLDFPYEETILPVTKRKLMQHLMQHSIS